MLLIAGYFEHNRIKEDNTNMASSVHIVKKKGIHSLLSIPELNEPLSEIWADTVKFSV